MARKTQEAQNNEGQPVQAQQAAASSTGATPEQVAQQQEQQEPAQQQEQPREQAAPGQEPQTNQPAQETMQEDDSQASDTQKIRVNSNFVQDDKEYYAGQVYEVDAETARSLESAVDSQGERVFEQAD